MSREAYILAVLLLLSPLVACAEESIGWRPVHTDLTREEKAKRGPSNHRTAPDVLGIETAHLGGNRIAWRITFAEPFVADDTLLILYLDTDSDERTSRTGHPVQGTDRMIALGNGEVSSYSPGSAGGGRRTSSHSTGQRLRRVTARESA